MPTYNMLCEHCGWQDTVTQSIHDDLPTTHWVGTPTRVSENSVLGWCTGPVVQVIDPPAIIGMGDTGRVDRKQLERQRDVDAYKRLRANGVQPPTVADSHEIEARANEVVEVEKATAFEHKGLRRRMQRAATEAAEAAA